jgi:hypothetical protein
MVNTRVPGGRWGDHDRTSLNQFIADAVLFPFLAMLLVGQRLYRDRIHFLPIISSNSPGADRPESAR